jgi:hypothetical protein
LRIRGGASFSPYLGLQHGGSSLVICVALQEGEYAEVADIEEAKSINASIIYHCGILLCMK